MTDSPRRVPLYRKETDTKVIKITHRPIRRPLCDADAEAALASEEIRGPVQRWARLFGLWGPTALLLLCAAAVGAQTNLPSDVSSDLGLPTVRCLDHAFVGGDDILLANLAEISAFDAETDRALRQVYLGPTPRLGQRRQLSSGFIAGRLAQAGWGRGTLAMDIPASVTIEREARMVGHGELIRLAENLLPAALPHEADRVIIDSLRVPRELALPPGEWEWALRLTGSRRTLGPVSFALCALDGETEVGRALGTAQVDVAVTLVETVVDVPRGALLTADLLRRTEGTLARAPRGALTDPGQAVGLVTTQALRAGSVMTERSVAAPRLIRRGEIVTMVFESGSLRITDRAVSTQDGAAGDLIVVQNIQSQRPVRALVTGPRMVRVLF